MKIADLFVGLGIKGSEKTVGELGKVKGGLEGIGTTSLATKAAIIGAMYALQRLFANSSQAGTDLTNFNAVLGVSTKTLQQYQYAARQVGASNQDVESTFKGLSSAMTKTLMGQGTTAIPRVATVLQENWTPKDIEEFAKKPQLLLQKLQEYAKKETNTGLRNEILRSFSLNDKMIAALDRKAFTPEVMAKAPTYNDKEIDELQKADTAWTNLGAKIEMAVGKFNAAHGGQLVTDISKIVDQVVILTEAFTRLAEKLKLFQAIGMVFEGWGHIFNGITSAVDALDPYANAVFNTPADQENKIIKDAGSGIDNSFSFLKGMSGDVMGMMSGSPGMPSLFKPIVDDVKTGMGMMLGNQNNRNRAIDSNQTIIRSDSQPIMQLMTPPALPSQTVAPNVAPINTSNSQNSNQNINFNQNLNFQHDGKNSKETASDVNGAVQKAFRQLSSQVKGS